ncbi:hypothetical protein L249_6557 [Ophiocordyceps polyrhachis-furcata BCC 54312]|uniref:Phosphatidate phosphatase APP1 catalytic domain-containing protein n=1 Tax=Ophiocordyceps polyrhachis-furcata BCC 54312 TaxID=1330021 RepID=A0A367LLF9_9HYPO|nr:hypothetical protein L249_6557 [Ophiocordyceps polyrhachis-furcata BCC 54312]
MPTLAELTAGYGDGGSQETGERAERGYRRRKLAAMAGNLYRSGQQAVTDFRESYAQVRARGLDDEALILSGSPHIPGSFPDVAITSQGDEQMVLFPSYAKRHVRKDWSQQTADAGEEHFWRQEWERHEDEKAVVDVDVRGWIYSPQMGPMTKRNRMLIGLARQLSGVPAPSNKPEGREETVEQEKVAQEAAMIERRGREQQRLAATTGTASSASTSRLRENLAAPGSRTASPARSISNEMSEAELVLANANLMARVAPFLTSPRAALPMTIFFYNDEQSQSRTVSTNDAGHFAIRAQLDFVPTGIRVLANERLSAMQDVTVIEPRGVSLISDVDDTVKHSNISAGAREIFRNTFVRELADLKVEGVEEWYGELDGLGVSFHYCSNSPWQLFPVLASFFKLSGLPAGSLHLKHYSGMLQGIFEPVAERKRVTLNELFSDFPHRKFLLVGDSGEADLEVYTELALANPGRVLAIFIRDVTTPAEKVASFSEPTAAPELELRRLSNLTLDDGLPPLADEKPVPPSVSSKPVNGTAKTAEVLIDFSTEPEEKSPAQQGSKTKGTSAVDLLSDRRPPPPAKPASLRGRRPVPKPSEAGQPESKGPSPPRPPPPRRTGTSSTKRLSPPTRPVLNRSRSSQSETRDCDPSSLASLTSYWSGTTTSPPAAAAAATATATTGSPVLGPNKKLDLWLRRLERANDLLERGGVALYTWRRGQDVMVEASAIVRDALREMGEERGT